jgi:hypothetical protein
MNPFYAIDDFLIDRCFQPVASLALDLWNWRAADTASAAALLNALASGAAFALTPTAFVGLMFALSLLLAPTFIFAPRETPRLGLRPLARLSGRGFRLLLLFTTPMCFAHDATTIATAEDARLLAGAVAMSLQDLFFAAAFFFQACSDFPPHPRIVFAPISAGASP